LTQLAYEQLREMIVALELTPGTLLTEQGLSQQMSIGRTPIREAIQRLAHDGLLVILPRRGVLVAEIDVTRQLRLIEVRRELERLLARLAAERATAPQAAEFLELATAMHAAAATADDVAFLDLDHRFNALLLDAAGNEFVTRCMSLMNSLTRRFWHRYYKRYVDIARVAALHAEVASAVAAGDGAAAGAASDRLLTYIEEFTRLTVNP
jgi:DNA-binding GntR family transcriptional regulator